MRVGNLLFRFGSLKLRRRSSVGGNCRAEPLFCHQELGVLELISNPRRVAADAVEFWLETGQAAGREKPSIRRFRESGRLGG